MMQVQLSLLAALLLGLSSQPALGQLSLPPRHLGYAYNKDGRTDLAPKIEVAAYLDPTCPDSQAVYPTMMQIVTAYQQSNVQFRMYLFPLPYHRNSHTISKAARVLNGYSASKTGNSTVFQWIDLIYQHINEYTTSATTKQTDVEVLNNLTVLAHDLTGIPKETFIHGVQDDDIDLATRLEWKYGCTRGVYGTPMFTINDVFVDAIEWKFEDWKKQLDKLLG